MNNQVISGIFIDAKLYCQGNQISIPCKISSAPATSESSETRGSEFLVHLDTYDEFSDFLCEGKDKKWSLFFEVYPLEPRFLGRYSARSLLNNVPESVAKKWIDHRSRKNHFALGVLIEEINFKISGIGFQTGKHFKFSDENFEGNAQVENNCIISFNIKTKANFKKNTLSIAFKFVAKLIDFFSLIYSGIKLNENVIFLNQDMHWCFAKDFGLHQG